MDRLLVAFGVHSDGSGVYQHVDGADDLVDKSEADLSVGDFARDIKTEQACLANALSAYCELKRLAHQRDFVCHCARNTAAAENHYPAVELYTSRVDSLEKAVGVGGEALCFAAAVEDCVHAAVHLRLFVELVEEGNNALLVGNSDIVAVELCERLMKFFL